MNDDDFLAIEEWLADQLPLGPLPSEAEDSPCQEEVEPEPEPGPAFPFSPEEDISPAWRYAVVIGLFALVAHLWLLAMVMR